MTDLYTYGWNDYFADAWKMADLDKYIPARVIADHGGTLKIVTPDEYGATISGKFAHFALPHELPKIGDWVAAKIMSNSPAVVHAVLPRKSEVSRKMVGDKLAKQVLAANIDCAFVVQALDDDFSPSRLERYTNQLRQINIEPIFIFNKADKVVDLAAKQKELDALNIPYIITSTITLLGIDAVAAAIKPGKTAVFLGSSGVGKSTLTNKLLGTYRQKTAEIRESDSKGRHTTSHRELFILPNGGLIIDTPGIRELQLWGEEASVQDTFPDIENLALQCKYRTCSHTKEAGCAVLAAIRTGGLTYERLESYRKLKLELRRLATQITEKTILEKRLKAKRATQALYATEDDETF